MWFENKTGPSSKSSVSMTDELRAPQEISIPRKESQTLCSSPAYGRDSGTNTKYRLSAYLVDLKYTSPVGDNTCREGNFPARLPATDLYRVSKSLWVTLVVKESLHPVGNELECVARSELLKIFRCFDLYCLPNDPRSSGPRGLLTPLPGVVIQGPTPSQNRARR